MFENLTNKFEEIFSSLKKEPSLNESQVDEGLRKIRQALLEADVALPVTKELIKNIKPKAIGQEIIRSTTPGQMIVKVVFDELVKLLGDKNKEGQMRAMYEPIHGSAPDIAGKGIANPIATILSFAMALKYSLNLDKEANALEKAVQDVLDEGLRTRDIISKGKKERSTSQMGDAIISKLQ